MTLPQKWILHHLSSAIIFIDQQMEQFAWRPCADEMSSFFYTRFCDVFLEFSKTGLAPDATTTPRQQV
jgi:valyl-tRNA synthetase